MKIGIIGGGISGLSLAILLKDSFEVEILEKEAKPGGIARAKVIKTSDGEVAYHTNGGHCFNSKYSDVLEFVFNILNKDSWHYIKRECKVLYKGRQIGYPIEFALREINTINSKLALKMATELLNASYKNGKNLEEWFINHFGETLAKEYFIPYNTKIWGIEPKNMDNSWIADDKQIKLPVPTKEGIFQAMLEGSAKDLMPHVFYYYPQANNGLLNALEETCKNELILNYKVEKLEKIGEKWLINGEKKYDLLINTSPLDVLGVEILNVPDNVKEAFLKLKFNKVSTAFCKSNEPLNFTWGYVPDSNIRFHRLNCVSSYFGFKNLPFCTIESIGEVSEEIFKKEVKKVANLEVLECETSKHAYVLFDLNYKDSKQKALKYVESLGIIPHGRFGEWEYYNMDVCIKRSIDLAKALKAKFKGV
ncbi:MAG: NAD(P)-binding protein [Helicobacter sp.]|nr:NAD(P)-binding protein [Helicobacter sp.]